MKQTNPKEKEKYSLKYPSYVSPQGRLWLLQEKQRLVKDGKTYEVIQIVMPCIEGDKPKVVLKEISNAGTTDTTTEREYKPAKFIPPEDPSIIPF